MPLGRAFAKHIGKQVILAFRGDRFNIGIMPRVPTLSLLAVLLATIAGIAPAAATSQALRYEANWGGLHAGDLTVTQRDQPGGYATRFDFVTTGMLGLLLNLGITAEASGTDPAGGPQLLPRLYAMRAISRRGERQVELDYRPEGLGQVAEVTRDLSLPAEAFDDEPPVTAVTAGMRAGTVDPLTAIAIARRWAAAGAGQTLRLAMFDGRRRYDVTITQGKRGPRRVHDTTYQTIGLHVAIQPVAGFKRRFLEMWKDTAFDAYLDERTLAPVQIVSQTFFSATVINLMAECPPSPACMVDGTPGVGK